METDAITALLHEVAADVITPRFRALADGEVDEKNPGDLVTVADREAEVLLTAALQAAYPDAVVLGEEAHAADPRVMHRYRDAAHAFTVDPVDGTRNFVHGSPDHAVMVAELRDGAVVRSWIYQPQWAATYVAERGSGAFCNAVRLTAAPTPPDPASWRGVTSRWPWVREQGDGLAPLEITWACCGVDYPRLLSGEADYVLYRGLKPWDHAPGSLLVTEAGGAAAHLDGAPYQPRDEVIGPLVVARDAATVDVVLERLAAAEWLRG
ncbi:inositol monophosphatase [Nocardioides sp. R-C-SC26]|uniref:inositol monophosphatase family protein n=1 Tax=Nocardioides sp. R-C-SC26 TaxID=2870414 RepID=UPI001E3180A7|nr:inositol monophosphatase [Nocardioides sp. R-C-SC26]